MKKLSNSLISIVISFVILFLALLPSLLSNEELIGNPKLFTTHTISFLIAIVAAIVCVIIGVRLIKKGRKAFGIGLLILPSMLLLIFAYTIGLAMLNVIMALLGFA